jgi:cytochrome bd-type quinol oxidase subunit 2
MLAWQAWLLPSGVGTIAIALMWAFGLRIVALRRVVSGRYRAGQGPRWRRRWVWGPMILGVLGVILLGAGVAWYMTGILHG